MKIDIKVPSSLKDIRLSQFQKFLKTTEGSEDMHFIHKQMVGIFCNIPDSVVNSIKAIDFVEIVEDIQKVLNEKPDLVHRFDDGVEYGFIPKIEDITVAEKADLDAFMDDWQKMDKAMAVCYRPIKSKYKKTYLIEDYTGNEEPLNVTLDVAMSCMLFFYNLMKDLLNYTLSFIANQAEQDPKISQTLEKNGDGIRTYMQLLKGNCLNLMQ